MSDQPSPPSSARPSSKIGWTVVLRLFVLTLIMMAILFLAAGKLNWWEGWAYVIQGFIVLISSRVILLGKNQDLARERSEGYKKEDVLPWDRILMPLMSLGFPLITYIVSGLDERFGWSPDLPNGIQIMALVLIFAGSMLGTWAMIANCFFSSHVRIQTDRGHTVVNSGPYRFTRHPSYAGVLLAWIATPIFFSSTWAAIPAVLAGIVVVLRTALEDRTLQAKLPGYREYAQIVRYRLVPGIW